MTTNRKMKRTFKESFKKQMVELHKSGKTRKDSLREYDLTASTFDKWVKHYNQSGSFKEKDNLTPEEKMCRKLDSSRGAYYYEATRKESEAIIE